MTTKFIRTPDVVHLLSRQSGDAKAAKKAILARCKNDWINCAGALVILKSKFSEGDSKNLLVKAIEGGQVRTSSALLIHEGDVGDPYPDVDFWENDTFFHKFKGQTEDCWVRVSSEARLLLPIDIMAASDGWSLDQSRISWARGDFVAVRQERPKKGRPRSRFTVVRQQSDHEYPEVGRSMIRRFATDLHFHRDDVRSLLSSKPKPPFASTEPPTKGDDGADHLYDWRQAINAVEERITNGTMNEFFGPLSAPYLTASIAKFLRDKTTNRLGKHPAMRTARTRARRLIEDWRKADSKRGR